MYEKKTKWNIRSWTVSSHLQRTRRPCCLGEYCAHRFYTREFQFGPCVQNKMFENNVTYQGRGGTTGDGQRESGGKWCETQVQDSVCSSYTIHRETSWSSSLSAQGLTHLLHSGCHFQVCRCQNSSTERMTSCAVCAAVIDIVELSLKRLYLFIRRCLMSDTDILQSVLPSYTAVCLRAALLFFSVFKWLDGGLFSW